jgi:hypothetical protein
VVDDLEEHRGFRCSPPVVLELLFCFLPCVAPEHTGLFEQGRLGGVLELVRSAGRDSGQASGRAMHRRSQGLYVGVGVLDLLGDARFTPG